jgi:carbonic anhydrase/acetyltransferase-like protein (isoleucine patch superfamily)
VGRGALVAAGALVAEDMEIGPGLSAVGVPARIRDVRLPDGWMERAVRVYVENGRRHRRELRRVGRD